MPKSKAKGKKMPGPDATPHIKIELRGDVAEFNATIKRLQENIAAATKEALPAVEAFGVAMVESAAYAHEFAAAMRALERTQHARPLLVLTPPERPQIYGREVDMIVFDDLQAEAEAAADAPERIFRPTEE